MTIEEIIKQHKEHLTKAQISELIQATERYKQLNAANRANAISTLSNQYRATRRGLQNMGLAGRQGKIVSGQEKAARIRANEAYRGYNRQLNRVENAYVQNAAIRMANETIRRQQAAAQAEYERKLREAQAARQAAEQARRAAEQARLDAQYDRMHPGSVFDKRPQTDDEGQLEKDLPLIRAQMRQQAAQEARMRNPVLRAAQTVYEKRQERVREDPGKYLNLGLQAAQHQERQRQATRQQAYDDVMYDLQHPGTKFDRAPKMPYEITTMQRFGAEYGVDMSAVSDPTLAADIEQRVVSAYTTIGKNEDAWKADIEAGAKAAESNPGQDQIQRAKRVVAIDKAKIARGAWAAQQEELARCARAAESGDISLLTDAEFKEAYDEEKRHSARYHNDNFFTADEEKVLAPDLAKQQIDSRWTELKTEGASAKELYDKIAASGADIMSVEDAREEISDAMAKRILGAADYKMRQIEGKSTEVEGIDEIPEDYFYKYAVEQYYEESVNGSAYGIDLMTPVSKGEYVDELTRQDVAFEREKLLRDLYGQDYYYFSTFEVDPSVRATMTDGESMTTFVANNQRAWNPVSWAQRSATAANWREAHKRGWNATDYDRTHDTKGSKYAALINEWSFVNGRTALLYAQTHQLAHTANTVGEFIGQIFGGEINRDAAYNEFRDECLRAFGGGDKTQMESMLTLANLMTDEERARFNTILKESGKEDADSYFEYLYNNVLPLRFEEYLSAENAFQTRDSSGRLLQSILSVPTNLVQGVVGPLHTLTSAQNDPVAARLDARKYNTAQTLRTAVGSHYGKVGSFLYGAGMSMADSTTVALISGGLGKLFTGIGVPAKLATKAGSLLGGSILGGSAFNSAYDEALQRGLSPEQARLTAFGQGVNEMLFESLSLDMLVGHFKKGGILKASKNGFVNWVVNTLVQGGVEGSEEDFTDMANNLWDRYVNGVYSEELTKLREYIADGMSFKEAKKKVGSEYWGRLGMSFLGGFVSGGVMGGGATFMGMLQGQDVAKIGRNLDDAAKAEIREYDYKNAEAKEILTGKLTDEDYGRLAMTRLEEMAQTDPIAAEKAAQALIDATARTDVKVDKRHQTLKTGTENSVSFDYDGVTDVKKMSGVQVEALRFAQTLVKSKVGGVNINVANQLFDKNGNEQNGWYDAKTNTVHVSLNGSQSVVYTISHELTHRLKSGNEEAYASMRDAMKSELESLDLTGSDLPSEYENILGDYLVKDGEQRSAWEALIEYEMDRYKKHNIDLDRESAEEEVVCRACETMLERSRLISSMISKNVRSAKTVAKFLASIYDDIASLKEEAESRGYVDGSPEKLFIDQYTDVEKIANAWASAMKTVSQEETKKIVKEEGRGGTAFSLKQELRDDGQSLADKSMKYRKAHKAESQHISDATLDAANKQIHRMAQTMLPFLTLKNKKGMTYLPDEVLGKTRFGNSSYGGTSIENTTICFRTLAYIDFTNEIKKQIGRPLTVEESFLASQMLYQIAKEPQCLYCYVSLDRKAYDEQLLSYIKQRDKVVEGYNKLSLDERQAITKATRNASKSFTADIPLYTEFLAGRKDTVPMRTRFAQWIDIANSGSEAITAADLATDERRGLMRNGDDWQGTKRTAGKVSLQDQVIDAERYAQSASWAKKMEEYRAYNGDILKIGKRTVKKLNNEYGLRFYSFSEYSPAFIVENMQQIRDAALKGLMGLAYTKKTDFARIFAGTGMNINVSTFGRWGVDADGNRVVVMDSDQGADWTEVQNLRKQYKNVGAVFVATDDAMTEWAIKQDWIDVVIPFHIVRTGANVAEFYKWVVHNSEQNDVTAEGKNATIPAAEHGNSYETYRSLVNERGLTPRFDKWRPENNPNVTADEYMKLVNETRRPLDKTKPLQPIYDTREAARSFAAFVHDGGYYGDYYKAKSEQDIKVSISPAQDILGIGSKTYTEQEGIDRVVADIKAGNKANQVPYGRQDIDEQISRLNKARQVKQHGQKFSIKESDAQYLDLARRYESGDKSVEADLRKAVQSAAKRAGYSIKAYHGTYRFGRTKFTSQYGALFLSSNPDVGQAFSGDQPVRAIAKQANPDTMDIDEAARWYKQNVHWGEFRVATDADFKQEIERLQPLPESVRQKYHMSEEEEAWKDKACKKVESKYSRFLNGEKIYYFEYNGINHDYANSPFADVNDFRNVVRERLVENDNGGGVYEMYISPKNMITVDANGAYYSSIPLPSELRKYATAEEKRIGKVSSDQLLRIADEAGYDTIEIKNVVEGGDYGRTAKATDYVVMNPESQAKSADLITKDDSGNIIPLSERFNKKNDDIRYSLKDDVRLSTDRATLAGQMHEGANGARELRAQAEKYNERIDELNGRIGKLNKRIAELKTQIEDVSLAERMHQGAEDAAALRKVRDEYNERIAQRDRLLEQVRKQRDAAKQHAVEVRKQERAARVRRDIVAVLKRGNDRIVKLLANPTENSHVPVRLAQAVAEYAQRLNQLLTTSVPMSGENAGIEKQTQKGELNARKILDAYNRSFADEETIALAKEENPNFDPRGLLPSSEYDETLVKMIDGMDSIIQGKHLTDLTEDELRFVLNTMRGVIHTVTEANALIGSTERKAIWEVGDSMIHQFEDAPDVKLKGYLETSLDLRRLARIFSGSNDNAEFVKLVNQLNDGAIEKERIAQVLQDIFAPATEKYGDEIRKWYGKKAEWIDTGITQNGKKVEITKGMRVSLAMHVLNAGNMNHIANGGITIPNRDMYNKGRMTDAYANGETVQLSVEQIEEIISHMTEAEKAYVEAAKEFFHKRTGYYINRTSLQLLGYAKAIVENYFPIHTDKNFTKTDFASLLMDGSIEGQGFLKERVNASNPVYLEDITSVVNRQIRGVALYAGLAVPMRNFNAVMNSTEYFEDENGAWRPRTTVRKAMTQKMGEYGAKVVKGFLEDASEMTHVDVTPMERFAGKLATNYVKAVLLGNLKVAMKQVASYPTAAAVIPWKYLGKALLKGGRNGRVISRADVDLINQYTPLYQMRREGQANEIASIMAKRGMEQKLPWLLGWITKMDVMTVGRLWSAAEYMVADQQNLPVGSDEYYKAVAKVFNDTIQQTQPNFTPLQRNAALRSKNPVVRSLVLFGTQRMQNGGILMEAAYELKQSKGKSKAEIKAAKMKLGRAVASQIVQNILLIVASLGVDALRGRMKSWQDEDKDITPESMMKGMGDMFLSNFIGSFLGGSETYSLFSGLFKKAMGETAYDTEFTVPALDAVETLINFAQSDVPSTIKYLLGDHTDEEKQKKAINFSYQLAKAFGYATGIPLENALKDVFKGIIPAIEDISDAIKTGELNLWLHQSGKLDKKTTNANYKEWVNNGFKGSEYFYWENVLTAYGKREEKIPILLDADLPNEKKAMLLRMMDKSGATSEGTVVYKSNGDVLIDFANPTEKQQALPMPTAETEETATPTTTPTATPKPTENPLTDARQEGVKEAVSKGVPEQTAFDAFLAYQNMGKNKSDDYSRNDDFRAWLFANVDSPEQRAVLEYQVIGTAKKVEGSVTYRDSGVVFRDYTNESWFKLSEHNLSKDGTNKRYEAGKRLEKTGLSVDKTVAIYDGLKELTKKSEWADYLKKQGLTDEQINIFLWSRGWAK